MPLTSVRRVDVVRGAAVIHRTARASPSSDRRSAAPVDRAPSVNAVDALWTERGGSPVGSVPWIVSMTPNVETDVVWP